MPHIVELIFWWIVLPTAALCVGFGCLVGGTVGSIVCLRGIFRRDLAALFALPFALCLFFVAGIAARYLYAFYAAILTSGH